MPSVSVVPVYVEVPDGFERAVITLEDVLRRAGYRFYIGTPLAVTLEEIEMPVAADSRDVAAVFVDLPTNSTAATAEQTPEGRTTSIMTP